MVLCCTRDRPKLRREIRLIQYSIKLESSYVLPAATIPPHASEIFGQSFRRRDNQTWLPSTMKPEPTARTSRSASFQVTTKTTASNILLMLHTIWGYSISRTLLCSTKYELVTFELTRLPCRLAQLQQAHLDLAILWPHY